MQYRVSMPRSEVLLPVIGLLVMELDSHSTIRVCCMFTFPGPFELEHGNNKGPSVPSGPRGHGLSGRSVRRSERQSEDM